MAAAQKQLDEANAKPGQPGPPFTDDQTMAFKEVSRLTQLLARQSTAVSKAEAKLAPLNLIEKTSNDVHIPIQGNPILNQETSP